MEAMTLAFIDSDEWYPCYSVADPPPEWSNRIFIDVRPDILARWHAAQAEWEACQNEMVKAYSHMYDRANDRTERDERIVPTWPPRPGYEPRED